MKYSIITFGCRVNQADSLGFEEQLRARGATCEAPDRADLVIVNTCSVTASADQGARQTMRRLARTNPGAKVVVTGCYATRRPEDFQDAPNLLRVISNDDKSKLAALVADDFGLTTAERFGDGDGGCGADIEPGVMGRTAFTLRVQTGCSQPCSYCIIPATRGAPRSLSVGGVLGEADRVVAAGFKEVALTGVHLGSFGRDLDPPAGLIDLLRALDRRHGATPHVNRPDFDADPDGADMDGGAPLPSCKERSLDRSERSGAPPPSVRFRISSLEPMDCSRQIVDLVASGDLFAPHFHLPLQHASERMLTSMRRPYTLDAYAALVSDIRRRMPEASIGSDLIVGFPGERAEDFERLCAYLSGSPLTHLHVFPYSDRPGTEASLMDGKVNGALIRARAATIRDIGQRLTSAFRAAQVGTTHRALTIGDGSTVVTGNYLKVSIPPGRPRNEWVTVTITGAGDVMRGEEERSS